MNKYILAASAAVAAATMTPAANATVYLSSDPGGILLTPGDLSDGYDANTTGSGPVFDEFLFVAPISGVATASATFASTPATALSGFTGQLVNADTNTVVGNFAFTTFGSGLFGDLAGVAITGGANYKLVFSGSASAATSYGGNLTVVPVPEPATWAMMVAGIAAVGMTMRRRSQAVRIAFS